MAIPDIYLLARCSGTISPARGTSPYAIVGHFGSRATSYSYTSLSSHLPFVLTNLCLSRLQLAHIHIPLNLIVIMPSHSLQHQVHVRLLVVFRSTSVALIPTPINPQNFRNIPRSVLYHLLLSKFLKGGTTRCVSLHPFSMFTIIDD